MSKDYYDIAISDYKYLNNCRHILTNGTAVQCQQVVEKLLKSVLEIYGCEDTNLLHSRNLIYLYDKITDNYIELDLDVASLSRLKDIYFDGRYPGKNYIEMSEKQVKSCLQLTDSTILAVNKLRVDNGLNISEVTVSIDTDNIFMLYRNKYNLKDETEWVNDYIRISKLCKSKDAKVISKYIKENFL